ncbi:MAG TPA: universal stress protein [Bryobacteraceae bacterium]|nr:universal stress protein [Bryobacteraceae bacterium]
MISFSRILFPVDLSQQSRDAAPFVKALAKRCQSQLSLLHVVEVPPTWYGASGEAAICEWMDWPELLETRRRELQAFQDQELRDIAVEPCVQSGDAAGIIARVAHQKHVDLIMMPTHGYGPLRGLLLGSVTAKILHDAECPVWTVTHPADFDVPSENSWQEIVCAISGDPSKDLPLVRWTLDLARQEHANVQLVHAIQGYEETQFAGEDDPMRDFIFNVARERIRTLQQQADTNLVVTVQAGRTGHVVREVALGQRADLIVAGRGVIQKPLGRLRSNAYAIVRDAPCPVISV